MNINEVKNITVIGAGVMGNSIALVFAQHGYNVRLCDRSQEILVNALSLVKSTLETLVEFGRLPKSQMPVILDHICPTTDLVEAVKASEFVLEAVYEKPEVKKRLFSQLSECCPRDTVLASNTSGLDIFNIVEITNPERFLITHWFSPAHIIPLVEVVPGKVTSSEVVNFTVKLMESVGKKPIILKTFVPAFIVNRIQNAINKAVFEMVENGWATPEDIDRAVKHTQGIRLPVVGVAQVLDFSGLDLIHDINDNLGIKSTFIEEKVRRRHLGAKTSKGIYDYGGRSEAEILKKRDELYFKMLDHLEKINAFEPV